MSGRKGQRVRLWTPEEHARMLSLKDEGRTFAQIGAELGRTELAVKQRHHDFKEGGGYRRTERQILNTAIEAREETKRLEHPTITAAFFGDPLPGRSALDRRNTQSSPSISLPGRSA